MSKTIKNTFSGGELSPDIEARNDLAKYATGAELLKNFFPTRFGGVSNRPGTEYVAGTNSQSTRLVPFQFSVTQTYVLEFAESFFRVFKDGGVVLSNKRTTGFIWQPGSAGSDEYYLTTAAGGDPFGDGNPVGVLASLYSSTTSYSPVYENGTGMTLGSAIGSLNPGEYKNGNNDSLGFFTIYVKLSDSTDPDTKADGYIQHDYCYASATLTSPVGYPDMLKEMTVAQDKDTLFLAHESFPPQRILRTADDAWTLSAISFTPTGIVPTDFYATTTGFTANDRTAKYKISSINEDLQESLPTDELNVTVDLNWPAAGRVDLAWNNITDGLESAPVFRWVASASGTNEYYCELSGGVDPSLSDPTTVWEDKVEMTEGSLGSLAVGEWAYGDNDTLGFSTIYCRITGGVDPDTKAVGYITFKLSTEDQWSVYKNYDGDWGWLGTVQTPWFLDYDKEPLVSVAPKENRDPFNTGDTDDYPAVVGIYQQRLFFARSNNAPQKIWSSVSGGLTNFATSKPLSSEDPITVELVSGGRVDEISHLLNLQKLLVFTAGSEWTLGPNQDSAALTPFSREFANQGYEGISRTVAPIGISNAALFVQRNKKDIRETRFNLQNGGYPSTELNILAQHLFEDNTIVDWCYQQHPWNIVWLVMNDGTAVSMTYLPDQELVAFARHETDGEFVACASIPTAGDDSVYFITERTVQSTSVYSIETLSSRDFGENVRDAKFLDSALSYNEELSVTNVVVTATEVTVTTGSNHGYSNGDFVLLDDVTGITATGDNADYSKFNDKKYRVANKTANTFELEDLDGTALTSTDFTGTFISGGASYLCTNFVSGLDHLEGETVSVLADGQAIGTFTVSSGSITLGTSDPGYGVVHVGLAYNCDITTLRFDLAVGQSTVQTARKRMKKLILRLKDSSGGYAAGNSFDNLTTIKWRQNEEWQSPNAVKTGDVEHIMKSGWDTEGRVYVRQSDPLPTTVLAMIMHYTMN